MTSAVFCLFRVLRLFLPSTTACRPFHFPFPCSPTTKGLSWRVNAHSRACSSSTQHSGLAVFTELPKITWIRRSNSCLVSSSWICSFLWKCQWVINFKTLFWNQCVNQSVCQSVCFPVTVFVFIEMKPSDTIAHRWQQQSADILNFWTGRAFQFLSLAQFWCLPSLLPSLHC